MILAAAIKTMSSWYQNLSLGWFDVALILVLAFGYWRGRKHGMSREVLPTSMWLVLVLAAGFGYQFIGQWLVNSGTAGKVFGSSPQNTGAYLASYLFIAIVVVSVFSLLGKRFREKVTGSNTLGSYEYYLGMTAGIIRYACILIFVLAFLNAPYYSAGEIAASKAYKQRWYGGGEKDFSGNYIPDLSNIQSSVFQGSFTGPLIKNTMGCLLINTGPTTKRAVSTAHH